jgi:hypothetical protein
MSPGALVSFLVGHTVFFLQQVDFFSFKGAETFVGLSELNNNRLAASTMPVKVMRKKFFLSIQPVLR